MRPVAVLAVLVLVIAACNTASAAEPVIGGPCEGCELVFEGMPDEIGSVSRIAPDAADGEALVIEGRTLNAAGEPVSGIVVYAYHTDESGIYPAASTRHGRFRGWARSDENGRYRFETIRPGGYPGAGTPQHVHMHVIEPGRATYWIDGILFRDDPRLADREPDPTARGGSGLVSPEWRDGTWFVTRDIVLGAEVPGYDDPESE